MISLEELEKVKDCARKNEYGLSYRNMWAGKMRDASEDNQRLLDLLEAAEFYAREDALEEAVKLPLDFNGVECKRGDEVRVRLGRPNGTGLEEGQKAVVLEIPPAEWISVVDETGHHWYINATFIEHIKPDSWEKLEEDTPKSYAEYWQCGDATCRECPALIDGKKPTDFYDVISCDAAQKLDLVARAKRLAEGGE